jgi:hypothetical protein
MVIDRFVRYPGTHFGRFLNWAPMRLLSIGLLSYMKSRTEYVRQEWVKELCRQIVTQKLFKRLADQWIDPSIEHSRLTMRIAGAKAT